MHKTIVRSDKKGQNQKSYSVSAGCGQLGHIRIEGTAGDWSFLTS